MEVQSREKGTVPDLKNYPDLSRDLSACKPCFDLIEYGLEIDLPDFVVSHPSIKALNDTANDLIIWANVSAWFDVVTHAISFLTSAF